MHKLSVSAVKYTVYGLNVNESGEWLWVTERSITYGSKGCY